MIIKRSFVNVVITNIIDIAHDQLINFVVSWIFFYFIQVKSISIYQPISIHES